MPDVSFTDFVGGLSADTIGGSEKIPVIDTTPFHVTPDLLSAYTIDQLVAAAVITTLNDSDELTIYQSDVEKIITAANLSAWIVDELEAITAGSTIVSGDTVLYSDGGVLKQIDIDDIVGFVNSENGTLGAQVAALSAATLADTDVYLLAQSGVAANTTFAGIAARVHSQILTYLGTLSAVTTLADANTFYVNQGGTAKSVSASVMGAYMLAEIGADVLASAWDDFAALGGAAAATDVFLLERSGTGKTVTGANLASYVVGTQDSASAADPAATGDEFLMFRSGTEYKVDIDVLGTYLYDTIWGSTSGNPVVDADKIAIGRSGDTLTVTAAQLQTYILSGIQADVFDLTGLSSATIDDTDLLLIGESTTGKKATAAALAAYILATIETDVLEYAWDNYAVVASGASGDILLLERAGVGKTIDLDDVAAYAVASQTGASAADPTASGDDFLMFRSGTQYTVDVDVLSTFVLKQAWSATSGDPVATGDKVAIGRSGTTYSVTVDQLQTFVLSGIQADVLDFSGLAAVTPASTDLFGVWTGSAAEKITLANLETQLWADFNAYVTALTAVTTPVDADVFYTIQSGTPKKVTATVLASYMDDELWANASALTPAAAGDDIFVRRSGTSYAMDIDVLATYINDSVQATVLDFSGLTADTPGTSDLFVFDDGAAKKITFANLEAALWADFATYVAALSAVVTVTDTDKFYTIQSGTAKYVTPVELATYLGVTSGDVIGPVTTTEDNIPQWDSTTKTLKNGLSVVTEIVPSGVSDSQIPTAKAVDDYFAGLGLDTVAGTGITAAAASYVAGVEKVGTFFRTTIVIDLTGLRSTAADDIIGADGTSNPCHIGNVTAAANGTIFAGKIECLETPAGGDPDIDLYSATESTGVEDAAISTLTETQLLNAGDHAANAFKSLTAFPAANEYLYLVAGATTDATYTAGILVITLWGK